MSVLAGRFEELGPALSLRLLSGWVEPENSGEEKTDQVLVRSGICLGWI